jgi:hypothetical protein
MQAKTLRLAGGSFNEHHQLLTKLKVLELILADKKSTILDIWRRSTYSESNNNCHVYDIKASLMYVRSLCLRALTDIRNSGKTLKLFITHSLFVCGTFTFFYLTDCWLVFSTHSECCTTGHPDTGLLLHVSHAAPLPPRLKLINLPLDTKVTELFTYSNYLQTNLNSDVYRKLLHFRALTSSLSHLLTRRTSGRSLGPF